MGFLSILVSAGSVAWAAYNVAMMHTPFRWGVLAFCACCFVATLVWNRDPE